MPVPRDLLLNTCTKYRTIKTHCKKVIYRLIVVRKLSPEISLMQSEIYDIVIIWVGLKRRGDKLCHKMTHELVKSEDSEFYGISIMVRGHIKVSS